MNNKRTKTTLSILQIILLTLLCKNLYSATPSITNNNKTIIITQNPSPDAEQQNQISNDSENSTQELIGNKIIRVAINPILVPMMSKFSDNFSGQLSFTRLDSPFNNESDGIEKLCYNQNNISILIMTRKLNNYEMNFCIRQSQSELVEMKIGNFAFIIIGNNEKKDINLTTSSIYKAIAAQFSTIENLAQNKYMKWSDINRLLPNEIIKFYGPFIDGALANYLVNRIVLNSCLSDIYTREKFNNEKSLNNHCKNIRTDGGYLGDSNDAKLTIQKILTENNSYGIVLYNIYNENKNNVSAHSFNGISPTLENIRNEKYGLSFPIYIYTKKNKITDSPIIRSFQNEIMNKNAIGENGYMKDHGLIALENINK